VLELLSLIGAPGLGKATAIIGDFVSDSKRRQIEADDREFKKDLAYKGQLKDYLKALHAENDEPRYPSLMSVTLCVLYIMFSVTACAFIFWCCYIQWELGNEAFRVGIKDPEQAGSTLSLLGGAIKYSWASKSVTFISPLGCAYLALHPLLYILGLVSSGRSPYKT
jgi:hypothetical protein